MSQPNYPSSNDHDHAHEEGLEADLRTLDRLMQQRRQILGLIAGGGAAALLGACGGGGGSSSGTTSSTSTTTTTTSSSSSSSDTSSSSSSTTSTCLADPTETNGPYPADGSNTVNGSVVNILDDDGIVRSDIRSSFGSSTTTAAGVPLVLTLSLVNTNASCAALSGYVVYLWHCNRDGLYSMYSSGITSENYLRGVQVADSNGQLKFTTIYPACYSGRYPHIHFEVYPSLALATSRSNAVLVSQMAMPASESSAVYYGATGYTASQTNFSQVSLSSDNVFGDNTAAQLAQQTPTLSGSVSAGYTGTVLIGLAR